MGGEGSGRHADPITKLLALQQQQQPAGNELTYLAGRGLKQGVVTGQSYSTGVSGGVVFAQDTGSLQTDQNNFFWDATNNRLGIGTTSPSSRLDINTGANDEGIVVTNLGTVVNRITRNSGGDGIIVQYNLSGTLKNVFHTNGNSYITGGNVGIGTTAPRSLLELSGATVQLTLNRSGSFGANLTFERISASTWQLHAGIDDSGDLFSIRSGSGNTNRFLINPSGAVMLPQVTTPSAIGFVGTIVSGAVFVSGGALWYKGFAGTYTQLAVS